MDDEWETEFDLEENAANFSNSEYGEESFRRAADLTNNPERSSGFRNVHDGSDLGRGTVNEEGISSRFYVEREGCQGRLGRQKDEEEEGKQGQKKGALNRSRKSGKKKQKEEGRKSIAGVISGSIQKLFGRSSAYEEKETINGLQSNATETEKHRHPNEANNDDDDYDDNDYDDDDNEESMWSDDEFDEEYDDDEDYSNVNELGEIIDFETETEKGETTTTTTTKSSSASTKATATTTNDLITFEPDDEAYEEMKVEEIKESLADTGSNSSPVAKSNGKVLANVLLSRRRDDIDSDLSKNIDHGLSNRVDNDRPDQETDQVHSIRSARRFFEVENNFKKSPGNELSKRKNEVQNFGPKNEVKPESTRVKSVMDKQDHLDLTKNKKISSNDKINTRLGEEKHQNISSNDKVGIRQHGENKQQTQRDLKTTNTSTVPTGGGQTCVSSGKASPGNRFVNKICTTAADLPRTTAKGGRSAAGSEDSPGGGGGGGGGDGEERGTSDVNRSNIAAVQSLVKMFNTQTPRHSPDLSRKPKPPVKNVVQPQQRLTGDSPRRELGIRESPALKKKPNNETPKPLNSARIFTATPKDCSAPLVLPRKVVNSGKRSPPPTDSGLPGSRLPPGSRTSPSTTLTPTDSAATVNCVNRDSSESSVNDGNRWKRPPIKAVGQVPPSNPSVSSKEPSKIGAKGASNEAHSVARPLPPTPTKSLSTDIPNSGTTKPRRNANVNQLGELRKNLRKTPAETGNTKYNDDPLVDRSSSKQSPSLPYKPQKFSPNGFVDGSANGSKTDEKQMAEKQLEQQLWYFGECSREECETMLRSVGQNGTFVVRRSKFGGEKCPYTLTVYLDQETVSLSIRRRPDNTFALGTEKSNEIVYNNVMEMVSFHRINPIRLHNDKTLRLKTSPPQ